MDIIHPNERIAALIGQVPIHEYAFFSPRQVPFLDEVRSLCEKNVCGQYGTCWACPPAVGTIAECRERCLAYTQAGLFTTVSALRSHYDIEGWKTARKQHEKVTDAVVNEFRKYDKDLLALSTEGCMVCKKCTYPDAPCTHPQRMYPATEGFGIMVVQLAKICQVKYNNGPNTVTYFSMLFFN
ncbi:MAG: DUF2284 domain-containing protein [Desulfopila sp.]